MPQSIPSMRKLPLPSTPYFNTPRQKSEHVRRHRRAVSLRSTIFDGVFCECSRRQHDMRRGARGSGNSIVNIFCQHNLRSSSLSPLWYLVLIWYSRHLASSKVWGVWFGSNVGTICGVWMTVVIGRPKVCQQSDWMSRLCAKRVV